MMKLQLLQYSLGGVSFQAPRNVFLAARRHFDSTLYDWLHRKTAQTFCGSKKQVCSVFHEIFCSFTLLALLRLHDVLAADETPVSAARVSLRIHCRILHFFALIVALIIIIRNVWTASYEGLESVCMHCFIYCA
jgi:hypothetical protein